MEKLLETSRMTDRSLWDHLMLSLSTLEGAQLGQLTISERRGLARRARECAAELRMRGQQLALYGPENR